MTVLLGEYLLLNPVIDGEDMLIVDGVEMGDGRVAFKSLLLELYPTPTTDTLEST